MTALPADLALTVIATDAPIISADHRGNYAAIQAAVNALIAVMAGGSAGQVLQAIDNNDVQWATGIPSGAIFDWPTKVAPSGFLICDGTSYLRSSYTALYANLVQAVGTVTVTLASPGVFTCNGHGLVAGDSVFLETTGGLPTGLSPDTSYYVIATGLTANNFELSATYGGSAINTSVSQSGVHTLFYAPHFVADSTHFNVPDYRGALRVGWAASGGHADVSAINGAPPVALASRRPKHNHTIAVTGITNGATGAGGMYATFDGSGSGETPSGWTVGPGGTATTDAPTNKVANTIIKT